MTGPSLVQKVASHAATAQNQVLTVGTFAPGFSGTTAAGNRLVLAVYMASGATITGIADSRGNTWVVDRQGASTAANSALASAAITTPLVTGDTITVTLSASASSRQGVIEVTGITGADQSANMHATGTSVTVATTAPSRPGDFVVSAAAAGPAGTITVTAADPDSGGTWADMVWPYATAQLDIATQAATAASLFSATWGNTASGAFDATIVSYKAAFTVGTLTAATAATATLTASAAVSALTATAAAQATLTAAAQRTGGPQ